MKPVRPRRTFALAALALFVCAAMPAFGAKWALLVGVGDYPGTAWDLDGPRHDVAALRRELIDTLGYPAAQVDVLMDANATRANILDSLRKLAAAAGPDDFVLVYFSGHGTSAHDPSRPVTLEHNTGALVPVDYQADGSPQRKLDTLLVGSRDLRPIFTSIDEKGTHGLVLIDSCYSRNTSRSFHAATPPAYRSIDSGLEPEPRSLGVAPKNGDEYPYSRVLTMTASGAKEVALDLRDPTRTLDGKPHGAFTDAVLRTLRELRAADANSDAVVTNREFFAGVKLRMAVANIPHSPQMLPSPDVDYRDIAGYPAFAAASTQLGGLAPLPAARLRVHVEGALPLVTDAINQTDALEPSRNAPDLVVRRSQGAFHILTPYGDAVATLPTERAAANALQQQPWIRELVWRLGQASDGSGVRLSLRGETFEEGEELEIVATPDATAHLLVLDIAPSGALRVLYPRKGEFGAVTAKRPVPFRVQVNHPFGMDYIVASAFLQAPSFYDARLHEDAEIAPNTPLHGNLVCALATTEGAAVAVTKVATVPVGAGRPVSRGT